MLVCRVRPHPPYIILPPSPLIAPSPLLIHFHPSAHSDQPLPKQLHGQLRMGIRPRAPVRSSTLRLQHLSEEAERLFQVDQRGEFIPSLSCVTVSLLIMRCWAVLRDEHREEVGGTMSHSVDVRLFGGTAPRGQVTCGGKPRDECNIFRPRTDVARPGCKQNRAAINDEYFSPFTRFHASFTHPLDAHVPDSGQLPAVLDRGSDFCYSCRTRRIDQDTLDHLHLGPGTPPPGRMTCSSTLP